MKLPEVSGSYRKFMGSLRKYKEVSGSSRTFPGIYEIFEI